MEENNKNNQNAAAPGQAQPIINMTSGSPATNQVEPSATMPPSPQPQPEQQPQPQPQAQPQSEPEQQPPLAQPLAMQQPPIPQPASVQQPQMLQPMPMQPVAEPMVAPQPNINNPVPEKTKSKKKSMIIGIVVGVAAAVAAALVVVLIFSFLNGGSKTVSCVTQTSTMGINLNVDSNVKIDNSKLSSGSMKVNVDLGSLSGIYKNYEDDFVENLVDNYKLQCKDHCTFDYNHVKGDFVEVNMQYDEEGVDELVYVYGTEGKSTQEVADIVQEALEDMGDTTCKQY